MAAAAVRVAAVIAAAPAFHSNLRSCFFLKPIPLRAHLNG